MACFRPLQAWQRLEPGPNGKKAIVWNLTAGALLNSVPILLPCHRCIGCRMDWSKQWALRCSHEALSWERSSFLTLTYSPQCLPPGGTLVKADFQKFMKRLRFKFSGRRMAYFMCGEYGEKGDRPHYHCILYGADFYDDRFVIKRGRSTLYQSPTLDELWGLGFASIGNVTYQSACYVARYSLKKIRGEAAKKAYRRVDIETGEEFDVLPPYNNMSLKPGIGKGFFDAYHDDIYPDDFCLVDGKKVRSPAYYDRLLEAKNPELLELVKKARIAKARENPNNSPERLAIREECLKAKLSFFKREIE